MSASHASPAPPIPTCGEGQVPRGRTTRGPPGVACSLVATGAHAAELCADASVAASPPPASNPSLTTPPRHRVLDILGDSFPDPSVIFPTYRPDTCARLTDIPPSASPHDTKSPESFAFV